MTATVLGMFLIQSIPVGPNIETLASDEACLYQKPFGAIGIVIGAGWPSPIRDGPLSGWRSDSLMSSVKLPPAGTERSGASSGAVGASESRCRKEGSAVYVRPALEIATVTRPFHAPAGGRL
jgi:hypothetical protein